MVLQGENESFTRKPGLRGSGFLIDRGRLMKVLLIMVVFNFETGSELETNLGFENEADCHAAALASLQEIDAAVDIQAMEIPDGQEMLEGTMIAYGAEGGEIGMYACNRLRSAAG